MGREGAQKRGLTDLVRWGLQGVVTWEGRWVSGAPPTPASVPSAPHRSCAPDCGPRSEGDASPCCFTAAHSSAWGSHSSAWGSRRPRRGLLRFDCPLVRWTRCLGCRSGARRRGSDGIHVNAPPLGPSPCSSVVVCSPLPGWLLHESASGPECIFPCGVPGALLTYEAGHLHEETEVSVGTPTHQGPDLNLPCTWCKVGTKWKPQGSQSQLSGGLGPQLVEL